MAEDQSKVPVAVLEYEPTAFEQNLLKHKSKLILVGVIAVAGTLGYWGWRLYGEAKHKSASVAFTRASTVEDLKKVASAHSGQTAAGSALIFAAQNLSTDKPAEAIGLLRDFLAQNAEHPLRDLAAWRVGEYTAATGDAAAADKEFQSVADANTPYSGFALLRLGDAKWAAGENDKAKEIYDKILTNPAMTGNPARETAEERVNKQLKVKPPVLVDPPPPPDPFPDDDLLPPPKGVAPPPPTPGAPNGLPPGISLPPGLSVDPSPAPAPPPPGEIKSPSLLDAPPAAPAPGEPSLLKEGTAPPKTPDGK